MAVPKSRHTKSKRDRRRAHIFLRSPVLNNCPKCGQKTLPHTICSNCGYYKNREVIDVLGTLEKKERKQREKEIKAREKEEAKTEKPLTLKELSKD